MGAAVLPPRAHDPRSDTASPCQPPLSSPGETHDCPRFWLVLGLAGNPADTPVPSGLSGGPHWGSPPCMSLFGGQGGQSRHLLLLPLWEAAASEVAPTPAGPRDRHSRVRNLAPRCRNSRSSLRRPPNPGRRRQRQAPAGQRRRRGRTALRSRHRSALALKGWQEVPRCALCMHCWGSVGLLQSGQLLRASSKQAAKVSPSWADAAGLRAVCCGVTTLSNWAFCGCSERQHIFNRATQVQLP